MSRHRTDRYACFLPANTQAIKDFIEHDQSTGNKPKTIKTHESLLIMFFKSLQPQKCLKDLTLRDIEAALNHSHWTPTSKEVIKRVLRQFFRFHNRPVIEKGIILNSKVTDAITKTIEDCLTSNEITRLINISKDPMYRALVEVFLITGCRAGEIQSLTVGGVQFDGNTIWINVTKSKTEIRRIPVVPNQQNPVAFYPRNLEAWIVSHPDRDNPQALLFFSKYRDKNYYGKKISECGMWDIIRRLGTEAGITKHIHPHLLRHTSASYDGQYLPEQMLCIKYGWVIGSPMARRYCHINTHNLQKILLEQSGITKDDNSRSRQLIENQQLKAQVNALESQMTRMLEILHQQDNEWLQRRKAENEAYEIYKSEIHNQP